MACRCGFQFCWMCLADDQDYKHTRDGRPCNKFVEGDTSREQAVVRANLARYAHFFERFKSHETAQQLSTASLPEVQALMEKFNGELGAHGDLSFLEDATRQVVECRRVLKWSYAHGFFAIAGDERAKDYF